MMDDKDRQRSARELAQARYWLRWHTLTYVLVNVGLVFIWWNGGMGYFWPVFPIFFWGIGLVVHYRRAYRTGEPEWIDRETEQILREREEAGSAGQD
jgi:hypothetical protein